MELVVIAIGIKTAGNLGALARLCDNFNCKHLIVIKPECDVTDQNAYYRASRGKQYLDNIIVLDKLQEARIYADIIIGLSARIGSSSNFARPAIAIQEIANQLSSSDSIVGIVVGREDKGLSNDEVITCDFLAHIPIPSDNPVLNISHAAVVALYELTRDTNYSSIAKSHRMMKREEKEYFLHYLEEILKHSWLKPPKIEGTLKVFRTMLSRSLVTDRESPALVGCMRSIHRTITEKHGPHCTCEGEK